jgi:hypothetical protein
MMGLLGAGEAQVTALPWKPLLACAVLAWCALRALEWAWWRPRRLGRELRSQGLRGTEYRSLAGDAPLTERLSRDARSRPLPLSCHDIVPRAMPMFHQTMKEHGASFLSFMWANGLNPCCVICEIRFRLCKRFSFFCIFVLPENLHQEQMFLLRCSIDCSKRSHAA